MSASVSAAGMKCIQKDIKINTSHTAPLHEADRPWVKATADTEKCALNVISATRYDGATAAQGLPYLGHLS